MNGRVLLIELHRHYVSSDDFLNLLCSQRKVGRAGLRFVKDKRKIF